MVRGQSVQRRFQSWRRLRVTRKLVGMYIVHIFIERRTGIGTVLNAVQSRQENGGKCQVAVCSRIRTTELEPF